MAKIMLKLIRLLTIVLELLSLAIFASTNQEIHCSFSEIRWDNIGTTLKTCSLNNQSIGSTGLMIDSPLDLTVKALNISQNKDVEYFPEHISDKFPKLVIIQVFNCSLKYVRENDFEGLHELTALNLSLNNIAKIESGAFKDNAKLEYLGICSNRLKHLSIDLFASLLNLKDLRLQFNEIQFINSKTFHNLVNLKSLNLDSNGIENLDSNIFETLVNLKNISIGGNQLEIIDENLFKHNMNVEKIWLNNNKLNSINFEMFDDMKSLKYVGLEGNNCIDQYYRAGDFDTMKMDLKKYCTIEVTTESEFEANQKIL